MIIAENSSPADPAFQAASLFELACKDNEYSSCSQLASLYQHGNILPQDDIQAIQLHRKSCDAGVIESCNQLGIAYAKGLHKLPKNQRKALYYFEKICNSTSYAEPCGNAALMHQQLADELRLKQYAQKACHRGSAMHCGYLRETK